MTQWLRLWHDMPTDPKWRVVAKKSGQRIGDVIAVYNLLLVCASTAEDRGSLAAWDDEDAGACLDLEAEDVAAIRVAMNGKVIETDRLSGWEKRQPKREENSTGRVQAFRERQAVEKRQETHLSDLETHAKHDETQRNAPEKRREETDKISLGASAPQTTASPDPFEEFWSIYPKRDGANPKKPAKAKFEKLCRDGREASAIIAAARVLASKHPKATPYVPQAQTWLNQERFDEADPPPQVAVVRDEAWWLQRLDYGRQEHRWSVRDWGPKPGDDGCMAPPALLKQGDGQGWDTRARNN